MKKQAYISVFDKTGVVDFAKKLQKAGYEIVSTGGTFDLLKENTDIHDKNLHNAAINAYRKTSQMAPGRIVDTYR